MAGDDDEIFMTRSLDVTPKTTEQHLSVRSDKSVACITNNKSLCSAFCTIEANYWQTRRFYFCCFYQCLFKLLQTVICGFTYIYILEGGEGRKTETAFRIDLYDFWDTFGTFYFERICQLYCHKFRKIKWRHWKPNTQMHQWLIISRIVATTQHYSDVTDAKTHFWLTL